VPALRTPAKLKLAYIGLAAADTWLSGRPGRGAHSLRYLTKPLLMPTLAASLVTDEQARLSPLRTSTLVAQAGGWGGDVALLGSGTRPFLTGVGSFALGHVGYLAGFVRHRGASPALESTSVRAVTLAWALTGPLMAALAARRQRELGLPVLGYGAMLAAMVASATRLDPSLTPSSRRLSAAGAGMFMLSDTVLGFRQFALTDPPPALETIVMATYTVGQLLLSEGAARA
jgi:uncharacterized membrane protein YhhN